MRIRQHIGNVDIQLNTDRLDRNGKEAQKLLNLQVVADTEPFIAFQTGQAREQVAFPQGLYGGEIEYYAPHMHYIYIGEIYGPNIPIKDAEGNITGWYSPPKKHPTGRKMQYHTPGTTDHPFEKAKELHKDDWLRLVRRTYSRN